MSPDALGNKQVGYSSETSIAHQFLTDTTSTTLSRTAIVLPARNEADTLGGILEALDTYSLTTIVVDDGSEDETSEIARSLASVLLPSSSPGYGSTVMTGCRFAIREGFLNVVTIDSDGAHDTFDVPRMLQSHFASTNLLTIGNRFSEDAEIPRAKIAANLFASHLVQLTLGLRLHDVTCGFRVLSHLLISTLIQSEYAHGYGFVVDALVTTKDLGSSITTCPVKVHYGPDVEGTVTAELIEDLSAVLTHTSSSKLQEGLQELIHFIDKRQDIYVTIGDTRFLLKAVPTTSTHFYAIHQENHIDVDCATPTVNLNSGC